MKILRYRIGNDVKPGILDKDDNIRDASNLVADWDNNNFTVAKLNEVKNINWLFLKPSKRIHNTEKKNFFLYMYTE